MIKSLNNQFPEILTCSFNKKKKINIKDYIEKNSDYLKKEYLDFCFKIENIKLNNNSLYSFYAAKNNHNFWEMSLIKEKSIIKSKKIYDVIIFLAIKKIVHDQKADKIILYNFIVIDEVINFFKNCNVELILANPKHDRSIEIKSFLKKFFLIYIFFYLCVLINKLCSGGKKKFFRDSENNFVFFSYFAHYFYKKKELIFNQFGDLGELLNKKFTLDYQYIFVPSKNNSTINSLPSFITNNYSFLNANINFFDKIFIIFNFFLYSFKFFHLKKKILLKLKNSDNCIFLILSEDYDSSFFGYVFLENLIWINIFENYLKKTKKKKYGIFLLENQAWEKAMITAWKNYGHGDIIGYTPTSINYWHMYNFDNSTRNYSSPTKIFISSNEGYKLLKSQYDKKKIKVHKMESLWFNYLIEKKITPNKNNNLVLILGDYDPTNNYKVFDIVSNSNLSKKNRILFKAHPHDLTKYNLHNIDQTKKSNDYFFDKASLIISSGSTAAILEYLYFGKKTFIYDNPFNFDMSPVKHLKYKLRFRTLEEFNNLLKINKKSVIKKYNNYYFLNKNLQKWREFFYI
jgi:surface carbohydrate biosynthesis protein (TIGR04326 family)